MTTGERKKNLLLLDFLGYSRVSYKSKRGHTRLDKVSACQRPRGLNQL